MALRRVGKFVLEPRALRVFRSGRVGPRSAATTTAAAAVAAGPMYGRTGSKSCGGGVRACTRQLDVGFGVDELGCYPNAGLTISIVGNTALVRRNAEVAMGAQVAVQLYPLLVWEGEASKSKESLSSVAGLGVRHDGKLLSLVAGRATRGQLAQAFVAEGCWAAGYTDAGPSAALWVKGEGFLGAHGANPLLPAWLVFMAGTPG